jgi:ubiquitin C-terminal hydrolase
MSTFDLKSIYPTLKFDKESEKFIRLFLEYYNNKIIEVCPFIPDLIDIQKAFEQITPTRIRKTLLEKSKNSKNSVMFLKNITNSLADILINKVVECSIKHKQKKLYPSCIILAISNDKELTILSNLLGIQIPSKVIDKKDPRTNKELLQSLRKTFRGITHFSREDLLFLAQPYTENVDSDIISFYRNKYNANNKKDYSFNDIVKKWDDYNLEVKNDYIEWLFPDEKGDIKLTNEDIKRFKKDPQIRSNVVDASLRMLLFYGFTLDKKDIVKQIKPINRRNLGRTIGLFSVNNYKRLTRIMDFLVLINMEYISSIFFLALCKVMKSNNLFYKKVLENKVLKIWMSTQNTLLSYVNTYDVNKIAKHVSREEVNIPCTISGLNYTGNSCYMDSALLSIFAVPNKTITDNILNKDLTNLKTIGRNLWSRCSDKIDKDIKIRQDIQKSINDITDSMRGKKNIKKCSNLRSLLKKCPGSQPFHGTETQDSGEFIAYLFNIFQLDVATKKRKSYGTNSLGDKPNWVLVSSSKDKHSSPIIDITSTRLQNIEEGYNITKSVKQKEDALLPPTDTWIPDMNIPDINYSRRKEVFKLHDSPLVIFNLVRTYGEAEFKKPVTKKEKEINRGKFKGIVTKEIFKKINAPSNMELKGKQLNLSAIVVHTGGAHYVANFKCNGSWFWYDDNPGGLKHKIKYTGSYDNMLQTKPNPLSHGTLYFYT